jgi:hypothetical protein
MVPFGLARERQGALQLCGGRRKGAPIRHRLYPRLPELVCSRYNKIAFLSQGFTLAGP